MPKLLSPTSLQAHGTKISVMVKVNGYLLSLLQLSFPCKHPPSNVLPFQALNSLTERARVEIRTQASETNTRGYESQPLHILAVWACKTYLSSESISLSEIIVAITYCRLLMKQVR